MRFFFSLLLCLLAVPFYSALADEKPAAVGMTSHKALYDIKMVSKHSGSQVINVSGQLMYEVHGSCEAWTTNHRFNLKYEYADSAPMQIKSDFSTYETKDGESFHFTSSRKRNDEINEEFRGQAIRHEDDSGTVTFSQPEDLKFKLAKGTLFPMAHTLGMLRHARDGDAFFNAVIFDGSDEDGPMEINAFIGDKVNALAHMQPGPDIDATLLNAPAWTTRLAFFPLKNQTEEAEYEMEVRLHENGIVSEMQIDYKSFSVKQNLIALEQISEETCDSIDE